MGWSGDFYYRSRRVNGRPRRVYVGTGLVAQLAAEEDERARVLKERERADAESVWAGYANLDADLREVHRLAEVLAKAALYSAGYYQPCRGDWRRNMNAIADAPASSPAAVADRSVGDVLRRASNGDTNVLPELQSFLADPAVAETLGNLSRRVEDELVVRVAGRDLTLREGLLRRLAIMREDLAGPEATALERQLVERIVLCWLAVHEAELRVARAGDMPVKQADLWQRRIDQAHRRYLSAVKMLATVRRLAIPVC